MKKLMLIVVVAGIALVQGCAIGSYSPADELRKMSTWEIMMLMK